MKGCVGCLACHREVDDHPGVVHGRRWVFRCCHPAINADNILALGPPPVVYNEPVISGFPDYIKPDDNCPLKLVEL